MATSMEQKIDNLLRGKGNMFVLTHRRANSQSLDPCVILYAMVVEKRKPVVHPTLVQLGGTESSIPSMMRQLLECTIEPSTKDQRGQLIMRLPKISDRLIHIYLKKNGLIKAKTEVRHKEIWIRRIDITWPGSMSLVPTVTLVGMHNNQAVEESIDIKWANILSI